MFCAEQMPRSEEEYAMPEPGQAFHPLCMHQSERTNRQNKAELWPQAVMYAHLHQCAVRVYRREYKVSQSGKTEKLKSSRALAWAGACCTLFWPQNEADRGS